MGFKHETPLRGWVEVMPIIKAMTDPNEVPLRGWKDILPRLGKGGGKNNKMDERTGQAKLIECGLLHYESGRPILFYSVYKAVRMLIGEGVLKIDENGRPVLLASECLATLAGKKEL